MLETGVFTLGVLTDQAKVDVVVPGLVSGNVLDQDNRGINVELLAESNVEGLVAGALDGGVQDTLEAKLVPSQGRDGLLEEVLRALVSGVDTADIDLLPLNGHIVGLEDGLHRLSNLSTDTVT